ncbi:hypothetical protein ILYODFUR_005291 [Ilyodon furcidens]|uniref:Uncharacterized protein n=1 Tax=Ilyodon furcidens TaxID=33524 RepID=A0ABV0V1D3_9TELE
MEDYINDFLSAGIIRPSSSPLWACNLSSTEQHQVNSLWIYLLKTWILNLIPPGDLTIITHEIFRPFRS